MPHMLAKTKDGTAVKLMSRAPFRTSTCRHCNKTIDKDAGDTIARVPITDARGRFQWVHEECAKKMVGLMDFDDSKFDAVSSAPAAAKSGSGVEETGSKTTGGDAKGESSPARTDAAPGKEKPTEGKPEGSGGQGDGEPSGSGGQGEGDSAGDDASKLSAISDILAGKMPNAEQVEQSIKDAIDKLKEEIAEGDVKRELKITTPVGDVDIEGAHHPKMSEIIELLAMNKNVMLIGPTGSGKTHTAREVADVMFGDDAEKFGLTARDKDDRFGFVSCSMGMSEGALMGRLLPVGDGGRFEYIWGEFIKRYENGGLFLWDEVDGSDSNVLLSVNAALANGFAAVYNRPEKPYAKMHPEFRCIAAANTWGRGGDRRYCGRSPLDESTLDRFRLGTIEFDYDSDLEKQLCPDTELYEKLTGVRSIIEASRLERVVSTRYFVDAFDALRHGWSVKRIVNRLCSGWRTDEYAKVHELIVSCTDEPRGGE